MTDMTRAQQPRVLTSWGLWAVIAGAVAMALVIAQIQLMTATAPDTPSIGQQIGEIAGDARRAAWRSFLGLPPPAPEPVAVSPGRRAIELLRIAVPVLGAIAIILSAVSILYRENWRLALYGAALGGGAMLFLYLWWVAVLIVACVILISIIENIGDIFGGLIN